MTHSEIENMYRRYRFNQTKLLTLKPKYTSVLSFSPACRTGESKIERLALERAVIKTEMSLVKICLRAMTKDEKDFITYRYFSELEMKDVASEMQGWTIRELYKLRTSVLDKTASILDVRVKT